MVKKKKKIIQELLAASISPPFALCTARCSPLDSPTSEAGKITQCTLLLHITPSAQKKQKQPDFTKTCYRTRGTANRT